ncbi:MAG: glycerate kinase, partial [Bacteroidetes bacterium]
WYLYDKRTKTAYVEMAKASGLMLISKLDVMNTSSFGTGQLIKHAIENGAKKIALFIGGSATNDAGVGIANALGLYFKDKNGEELKPIGKNLLNIHSIDDSESIIKEQAVEILIAADVNNLFYGNNGAAYVYAPQKGASLREVIHLDKGLQNISAIFKAQYNIDVQNIKGSGAAGGIGGGMIALFNAKLISGSELIFELTDIEQKIKSVDLIITGEGKIDEQTLNDKLIFKLSKLAHNYNKMVWAVCGYYKGGDRLKKLLGIEKIFSLAKSKKEIEFTINNAEIKLSETATEIAEQIKNFKL